MKLTFTLFFLFLVLVSFGQEPQVAFTITERDIIPEGIAYDPSEKSFYVGSIHKSKILKINSAGIVSDFVKTNEHGLNQVLGMKVDNEGKLWACNNTAEQDTINKKSSVHIWDLRTGRFVRKFTLEDGSKHLFNDLYFTASGDTYITDSDGGGVYVIRKSAGKLEEFIKPGTLRYPNGITATPDEKNLIVSTGSGLGIVTINLETREIKPLPHSKFFLIGADGLYRYGNSLIGVQNVVFPEGILSYTLNNDGTEISDIEALVINHKFFDSPTTGVIADGDFFFIANSQLTQLGGSEGLKQPEKLKETVIMKIKLK